MAGLARSVLEVQGKLALPVHSGVRRGLCHTESWRFKADARGLSHACPATAVQGIPPPPADQSAVQGRPASNMQPISQGTPIMLLACDLNAQAVVQGGCELRPGAGPLGG